jgi:hypothetical protein
MGVFGRVDDFQRQLDRVASLLDMDDEESLAEMVRGEWCDPGVTLVSRRWPGVGHRGMVESWRCVRWFCSLPVPVQCMAHGAPKHQLPSIL